MVRLLVVALVLAFAMPGCMGGEAVAARAELRPVTASGIGTEIKGWANMTDEGGKLSLRIEVVGIGAGDHGVHIHMNDKCGPGPASATDATVVAAGSAGGHFNPTNASHPEHAGDLGNLLVQASGRGAITIVREDLSLEAGDDMSVMARTVVVHAARDDESSHPSGNSGARILCGVIMAT